ncbi:MAG: PH domain-containing protein [Cellulosilyticaceae bacterium]
MGIFGNSKVGDTSKFESYLIEGEVIEAVYRLVLDEICFTNKRIILIDKEPLSTKKQLVNIPYSSIYYFSVEKGGVFELDNDVKLHTKGTTFEMEFAKGTDIIEVEKLLARHICK